MRLVKQQSQRQLLADWLILASHRQVGFQHLSRQLICPTGAVNECQIVSNLPA